MWLKGDYIIEVPDKHMVLNNVNTMRISLESMVINFTPFDPGLYILSGGIP